MPILVWEIGIRVTQWDCMGMTDTKMGMRKPKYHYVVGHFRVEITSRKAVEPLLIESLLFKYVLQDCILPFLTRAHFSAIASP